jgi:hypothetical protein
LLALGEINLTQLKWMNYDFVCIGDRSSKGVHWPRDQFCGALKPLERSETMNTCQQDLHAVISEVSHCCRELVDDESESDIEAEYQKPSLT